MKVFCCRLCHGKLGRPVLEFPPTPLANEFVALPDPQDVFPLEVCACETCGHYQLNESVNPERLFRNYLFVAGTSFVNVEHFRLYAEDMTKRFTPKSVLDIASNDGTLLQHFKNMGVKVLGIDPAVNLATEATKNGIKTIAEFFNESQAKKILDKYGQFDLITANNVFAHVPDLVDFAKGVKTLLSPNGVFSFEVSYFGDVCDRVLFDTIYHEHSSYHHVTPLVSFFKSLDLDLFDVERIPTHGGSIRVFVRRDGPVSEFWSSVFNSHRDRVQELLEAEKNISERAGELQRKVRDLGAQLREKLLKLKNQGKTIAVFGAPAKATTLMYAFGLDRELINFAVDDAPLKQGLLTPGKHIPVLHPDVIYERKPDVLLVLAWNFSESIIKRIKSDWWSKLKNYRYPTFITPLPQLNIQRYCENSVCTCGEGPWEITYDNLGRVGNCDACGGEDRGRPMNNSEYQTWRRTCYLQYIKKK